jgi:transposase
MDNKKSNKVVAGVDVSSAELVVSTSVMRKVRRYENKAKGLRQLLKEFQRQGITLVVLEHTGRHERALLEVLWNAGIAVHCAHPKSVHNFAKVLRANAKSDPLDAGVLREYGLTLELDPTPRPAQEIVSLQEIAARRADLNETLVQEKNRLAMPVLSDWNRSSIKKHIRYIEKELAALEQQMRELTKANASLSLPIEALTQEHGMGFISAATVFAHVPELGSMNRQRTAALLGLAPFVRKSGKWTGQSRIYGGRTAARSALYMPALTIIRKKGHPLRELYKRLKAGNKPTNKALTAVMRKLAIRLNTRLRDLNVAHAPTLN